MKGREEFYNKLKVQLEDTSTFPSEYLFKFIVPSEGDKVARIEAIFNDGGAVIKTRKSKTGKYCSVSISLKVPNASVIIAYYKQTDKIEGIISL